MARPSLFQHRKFRTLARRLGSRALAAGTLELLWAVANDAGDALVGTAEDVEDVADWRGEPGALVAILLACRFLDETPAGYTVHDHAHHCPSYVRRRRDRENARRNGDAPVTSQQRASDAPLTSTPNSHLPSTSTPPTPPRGRKTGKTADRDAILHAATKAVREPWQCAHDPPCGTRHECDTRHRLAEARASP